MVKFTSMYNKHYYICILFICFRQTNNELTGEHSCIMISTLNTADSSKNQSWLSQFWIDFRRRFISLLGYQFRKFSPQLALGVLHNTNITIQIENSKIFYKV